MLYGRAGCRRECSRDHDSEHGPYPTGAAASAYDRVSADVVGPPAGGPTPFDDAVRAALGGKGKERPEPGTVDPAQITAADPDWAG